MNIYATIILAALFLEFILGVVADLLNLRAMSDNLPSEMSDTYDAEAYRRSQEYTRAHTRLGLVSSTFSLALLLGFWGLGGFDRLDLWLREFNFGAIFTGLLFIGGISLAGTLLGLPFRLYSTFIIEEHFGFNRTTPRTFVLDLLKGLALSIALGAPVLALVLLFFERAGSWAWLACWGFTAGFSLLLSSIFPTWIMPLFNKFEPLGEGELRDALATYANSVNFALTGIFVIDGSRRSNHGNAFFTGMGKSKRIALFDTLIEQQSVSELVAVLAHEVGHYKKKHVLKGLVLSILHTGLLFYLLSIFLQHKGLFDAFGMTNSSIYAGLVFFGLLFAPIEMVVSFLLQARLRQHEFEADRFAAETTEEPLAMVSALKKLAKENLSNLTPHAFYVALNDSHPPVLERIRAIHQVIAVK
jgi:STE24 endopeptidase